jgi:hypothetical protein
MSGAIQPTLEPAEPQALVPAPVDAQVAMIQMIERVAANKDVDVDKLERLIAMQERVLAHNAEAEFNAAFADMQAKIPVIIERGETDKTTYATLEDIVEKIRPILTEFGFSISHRTEWPDARTVKVIGILTHRAGHSRQSEFLSVADQTGSKNAIQALGSAVSYGRRYTIKDLLNIATRAEDDDGERTELAGQPDAPDGYDNWKGDMEAAADEGWPKLSAAYGKSSAEFRKRATQSDKRWWQGLKAKAERVRA